MSAVGVVLLAFGEPEGTDGEGVADFLERIFLANRKLEPGSGAERARKLAEARAPGLIEAYRAIGGSPMSEHAHAHGTALASTLAARGQASVVSVGTQFATPSISDALVECRERGPDRLVALPLYPICGPTTTLAALQTVRRELKRMEWPVEATFVGGWHRHPGYVALRAEEVRSVMAEQGLDPRDPGVRLYFSAHGTPLTYLREGSRYQEYVEDSCALIADAVGVDRYELGYQNHTNRGVEWIEPSNETLIPTLRTDHLVVDPLSFVHEQSETLDELDLELRALVEGLGVAFHRVPTPHAHPEMGSVLADLVLEALGIGGENLTARCLCQGSDDAVCASHCGRS